MRFKSFTIVSQTCYLFYICNDLIMFLYTFLATYFDWYNELTNCLTSFNKLSELLLDFTFAGATGHKSNIYLGNNI